MVDAAVRVLDGEHVPIDEATWTLGVVPEYVSDFLSSLPDPG